MRLRARLSRSQNAFGKGLLALLSRDQLDDDAWDEIEESLITADVGVEATQEIVERLRERARVAGHRVGRPSCARMLAEELVAALDPTADRTLKATPTGDSPAVLLVVGVNGSGKTTTCGKIARVLVADGRTGRARRGRHVPGGGRRAARHLGRPGRRRGGPRARRGATRPRSRSTRSSGASRPRSTPC